MAEPIFQTREDWLEAAVETLRPVWKDRAGIVVPEVRVGVGFPSGGLRSTRLGQTWPKRVSKDNLNEITLRVTVDDALDALRILGGELIMASLDGRGTYGKRYCAIAAKLGYNARPEAPYALSEELCRNLIELRGALGDYPGDGGLAVEAEKRKQGTRMIRLHCNECGCTWRMAQSWIDRSAEIRGHFVMCPVCFIAVVVDAP